MISFRAGSEAEQTSLGKRLAEICPPACIIYLQGDLGTGKTTLVRGFLRGLGYKGVVKSPTYTLLEPYSLSERHCFHLDLYRMANPEELELLGFRDLLQTDAQILVEWPQRGIGWLPEPDVHIRITFDGSGRRLKMQAGTGIGERILAELAAGSTSEDLMSGILQ